MKQIKWTMNKEEWINWGMNLVKFTAPILVVLFALLSQGVSFEKAWPVAVLALWGALADFFKKFSEGK